LANSPTFKEFIAQVHRTVTAAEEHQDYPFPLDVEQLKPERDASRTPILQVAFNWHKSEGDEPGNGWQLEPDLRE